MKICQACAGRFGGPAWVCPSCGWEAEWHGAYHAVTNGAGDIGYSPEFFDHLPAAEASHFWFAARNALIAWATRAYFPGAASFLEVGCGTGQVVGALRQAIPSLRVTASEAFPEGLRITARRAPGVELVQADARALPWDAEFDVVGAFDVIEHIAEDAAAARQLAQAARPGGGVLVTVPQHGWLWTAIDDHSAHQRRYSRGGLVRLLESAGLRVERVTSFVSLLLPALLATRLVNPPDRLDVHTHFRISRAANGAGAAVMALERALIRAGVSFPAGGSLLAVARRPGPN